MDNLALAKRLDTIEDKLDKAIDAFSDEKEKMAVYKYRIEQLEAKVGGVGMFWRSVVVGLVVAVAAGLFNFFINQSKQTPDNSRMLQILEKIENKLTPQTK